MELIPWHNKRKESGRGEQAPLAHFRQEMERVFENFFREPFGWTEAPWRSLGAWSPAVDLVESPSEVTVRMEIPGVNAKDLDITIAGNTLVVSGEKREPFAKKEGELHHTESHSGTFRRSLTLPQGVDSERVEAEYENGVLSVRLQKTKAATPKRIEVRTS